eukprot:365532-Chlamydomonas_euryale.AAC.5
MHASSRNRIVAPWVVPLRNCIVAPWVVPLRNRIVAPWVVQLRNLLSHLGVGKPGRRMHTSVFLKTYSPPPPHAQVPTLGAVIDYVFASRDFDVVALHYPLAVRLTDEAGLRRLSLPNGTHPSDHLPVGAREGGGDEAARAVGVSPLRCGHLSVDRCDHLPLAATACDRLSLAATACDHMSLLATACDPNPQPATVCDLSFSDGGVG